MLRIRRPKEGFVEIAEEADNEGRFDESLQAILRLLRKAARERDARKTHLLTVSLHAFLHYKGGNYALPSTEPAPRDAAAAEGHAAESGRKAAEGKEYHLEEEECLQSQK